MKTPDEIKKGLEFVSIDCRDARDCDKNCAYYKACSDFYHEMASIPCVMVEDALAYIQQLEAANAELLTKCEQLETKCHQLERERDAAVEAIREEGRVIVPFIKMPCRYCDAEGKFTGERCNFCHVERPFGGFKWRGVKEE